MTEPLPPEDPRSVLIGEQAALLKGQAEQVAVLAALVAELREQLDAARRAASRNPGNSSMPSADDLPGRRLLACKRRRAAERAEQKRSRGKLQDPLSSQFTALSHSGTPLSHRPP